MSAARNYDLIYVACEDYNFLWTEDEVFDFDCQWNEGKTLKEIAEYFKRPQIEVLFLALDRAEQGLIKPLEGWMNR